MSSPDPILKPPAAGSQTWRAPRITRPAVRIEDFPAEVEDVGPGGLRVTTRARLQPGERLRLCLWDTFHAFPQSLDAEVVWLSEHEAGLRWVDLGPRQQEWLDRVVAVWLGEKALREAEPG